MRESFSLMLYICGIGLFFCTEILSQELAVKNVRFTQRGDAKVEVTYDLLGEPSKKCEVNLSLSISNYRKIVPLSRSAAFGDIGKNVRPGKGKRIVWDMFQDFPDGLDGDGFVFVVDAQLQKGGNKWPWIMTGLAATGGGAAYFIYTKQKNEKDTKGIILIEVPDQP